MYGQTLAETTISGYFGDKTAEEIYDIYEMLAINSQQKAIWGQKGCVHEVTTSIANDFGAQMMELSRNMNMLLSANAFVKKHCSFCRVMGHNNMICGMA